MIKRTWWQVELNGDQISKHLVADRAKDVADRIMRDDPKAPVAVVEYRKLGTYEAHQEVYPRTGAQNWAVR